MGNYITGFYYGVQFSLIIIAIICLYQASKESKKYDKAKEDNIKIIETMMESNTKMMNK